MGEEPELYTGCDPADQEDGFCTCTPDGPIPDDTFCVSDGENLFKAGPQFLFDFEGNITRLVQDIDGADVTDGWGSEKQDYSLPTNSCAPGAVCGHYTQVVWGDTQQLGCGSALCANNAQLWVCRYRPAGNFPTAPYAASEDDFEVTLLPEKDTTLRSARPDANEGGADTLRVAGGTRGLVGFSAATGTLGANVLAADLLLELETSNGWPEGRRHGRRPRPAAARVPQQQQRRGRRPLARGQRQSTASVRPGTARATRTSPTTPRAATRAGCRRRGTAPGKAASPSSRRQHQVSCTSARCWARCAGT